MNMAIISTAVQYGATVANHVEVTELIKDTAGRIIGTKMRDNISGEEWSTTSKVGSSCHVSSRQPVLTVRTGRHQRHRSIHRRLAQAR